MRSDCSLWKHDKMRGRAVKTLNSHLQHTKIWVIIRKLKWQTPGTHNGWWSLSPQISLPVKKEYLFYRTKGRSLSMTKKKKNKLVSCFCYFPHWHETHFSNPRKANAWGSLWKVTFLFPPEVSFHLVAGDEWTSAISEPSFQSFLLAKTVPLVVLYSKSNWKQEK